jgi:hypothetical protein
MVPHQQFLTKFEAERIAAHSLGQALHKAYAFLTPHMLRHACGFTVIYTETSQRRLSGVRVR